MVHWALYELCGHDLSRPLTADSTGIQDGCELALSMIGATELRLRGKEVSDYPRSCSVVHLRDLFRSPVELGPRVQRRTAGVGSTFNSGPRSPHPVARPAAHGSCTSSRLCFFESDVGTSVTLS